MTHARQEAIHINQMPPNIRAAFKRALRHRDTTREQNEGRDTNYVFSELDEIEPWFEEFTKSAVVLEAERKSAELRKKFERRERLREVVVIVGWSAVAGAVVWWVWSAL